MKDKQTGEWRPSHCTANQLYPKKNLVSNLETRLQQRHTRNGLIHRWINHKEPPPLGTSDPRLTNQIHGAITVISKQPIILLETYTPAVTRPDHNHLKSRSNNRTRICILRINNEDKATNANKRVILAVHTHTSTLSNAPASGDKTTVPTQGSYARQQKFLQLNSISHAKIICSQRCSIGVPTTVNSTLVTASAERQNTTI